MTKRAHLLANQAVRDLEPYQPGKPLSELERELGITDAIKLASNENPLGASDRAVAAMLAALTEAHIYPDGGYALKNALAKHCGVQPNQITLGNGSDNNLELITKTFLNDNDTAILSEYTFLTIPLLIKACGAIAITVPTKDFHQDVHAMLAASQPNTRVLFIVNPNNPTGTYINTTDFAHLMKHLSKDIIVVVDEAYCEYIDEPDYPNTLEALTQHENLIIVRTFSKAHGLAGLRLGYTLSSPEIADLLNRVRLPFNVNSIAAAGGMAALNDHEHLKKTKQVNQQGKQQLIAGLKALKLSFIPSVGNFITVNVGNGTAIYEAMLRQGVIVRPLNAYHMREHIRITISTPSDNQRCLDALTKAMALKETSCP